MIIRVQSGFNQKNKNHSRYFNRKDLIEKISYPGDGRIVEQLYVV